MLTAQDQKKRSATAASTQLNQTLTTLDFLTAGLPRSMLVLN